MNKKLVLTAMLFLASFSFALCQNYWSLSDNSAKGKEIIANKVDVTYFDVYTLDFAGFNQALKNAPMRGESTKGNELYLTLPNSDGQFVTYSVVEAPVMHPDLAAKHPGIKSYAGQGVSNPAITIRFSVSYNRGLYGMIFNEDEGTSFIDPYSTDFTEYMVYSKKEMIRTDAADFECTMDNASGHHEDEAVVNPKATDDKKLRKYRLALCCNAEYGNLFIGSATTDAAKRANILAQMNITMTRVNGVYEKDLSVTMELIANNDVILWFGSTTTDPWSGEFNIKTAQTIDANIGISNYDIGHNFNTSGGGNAGCIACVCMGAATSAYYTTTSMHKGKGMTGRSNPTGDAFDIDYVAHEMGHQFGGYHTMNTCSRSGSGSTEVEPTSGSTIMGYAGICSYNIQANSDDYFAYVNIRDISANVKSGNSSSCAQVISITNNPPTANAGADYTIPKSTAFVLTGSGTDPDGDAITYTWEQNDPAVATSTTAPVATWTAGPMFRSRKGTTSPLRYFPAIASIIANNLTPAYEVIPSVARILNFSLVTRDNKTGGGQTANDLMVVTINGTAGPFTVSAPNTAVTWAAGTTQTVTWNVAGTTASPVSCANVDIFLSTDGGYTYPITLLLNTPNDGTEVITVPNNPATTCRVMVKGANNIFFDISNANFTITGSVNTITSGTISGSPFCAGTAVSVPFTMSGTFNAGNVFTAQLSNATGSFASPVSIGTLTSTTAGTIAATIPAGTATGTGYRIRVVSSSPVTTGADNGTNLTINASSTPSVVIAGTSTICAGISTTFTATPTNGGTPSYQWKLNGANVGTNSATYTNAALANGNTVSCVMTTTVSCPATPTATSNTVTMTVNPTVTPAVVIAGTSTICAGTSTTFTATPTNGGTPSYQWKLNGANVGTNSATYTNATLANGNTVSCVMTTTASCPSAPTATSNTVTMTVNPTVTPAVAIAGTSTICSGTSTTFTATPTNGGTPSYQWKLNGANVGTNSATYTNATLANGNTVSCVMTTTVACPSTPTATSNTVTMTVNPNLTPSVVIAGISTICTGTSTTFTATPTNGGTPTYLWLLNGSAVGTNSPTYTNASLANNDVITCLMGTSVTCPTLPSANSNAITMTVNSTLTPSVIIAGTSTICSGTSTTFTATPTNGGTPIYQWKLNGSNVGTNSATYTNATLANGNTVSCVMTTSVSCTTSPTATSNTVTMTVNPTVTPSVAISADASTICSGASVVFTASPTNGGTPTYQWLLNGANVGTNSATYTNATLANGNNVSCVMTTTASCPTTPTATSNTVTMTVNPIVTPSIVIYGTSSICEGMVTVFNSLPTNGGTPTYQWKVNGTNVGIGPVFSSGTLINGDVIICEMMSSLSCVASPLAFSNTITMTVSQSVTPSVSISGISTICAGTSTTFTATPTNGGTPSYQWMLNGANVGANSETYSNVALVNADVVNCVMTSTEACITSPTATSNNVVMTVNQIPVVNAGLDQEICAGSSVTLSGSGAGSYVWDNGVIDGIAFNPLAGVITYNVTGTLNGCTNTDQVVVTVNSLPNVNAGLDQTVCLGASVTLSGSGATSYTWDNGISNGVSFIPVVGTLNYTVTGIENGCLASDVVTITVNEVENYTVSVIDPIASVTSLINATYQWIDCDNGNVIIPGEINTDFTPSVNGNYGVIVDQNGCSSTSSCVQITVTGISENMNSELINIYPNPSHGVINIAFDREMNEVNFIIENVIGQRVFESKSMQNVGSVKTIDLSNYSKGLYFINIKNQNTDLRYKIILEK